MLDLSLLKVLIYCYYTMGTHAKFCIRYKGKYYSFALRYDGYPSYSGVRLLIQLWTQDLDVWRTLLDKITILYIDNKAKDKGLPPITPDIVEKIRSISAANAESYESSDPRWGRLDAWSRLLENDLHDPKIMIADVLSFGYIIIYHDLIDEPSGDIFSNWVYTIDLDAGHFKIRFWKYNYETLKVISIFTSTYDFQRLPLYLCDEFLCNRHDLGDCSDCQKCSHEHAKFIFKKMFNMVVAMRMIIWKTNVTVYFPHEVWLQILKRFGESCGLKYSDATIIVKMTELSRYNHRRCLAAALVLHLPFVQWG